MQAQLINNSYRFRFQYTVEAQNCLYISMDAKPSSLRKYQTEQFPLVCLQTERPNRQKGITLSLSYKISKLILLINVSLTH